MGYIMQELLIGLMHLFVNATCLTLLFTVVEQTNLSRRMIGNIRLGKWLVYLFLFLILSGFFVNLLIAWQMFSELIDISHIVNMLTFILRPIYVFTQQNLLLAFILLLNFVYDKAEKIQKLNLRKYAQIIILLSEITLWVTYIALGILLL